MRTQDAGALPGRDALEAVCRDLGVDASGARMLPSRSNAVFHLPVERIVVRLSRATPTNEIRAERVIALTRWIAAQGGPALAPTSHPQPVRTHGVVATLWPYLNSPDTPRPRDLAHALQEVHRLDITSTSAELPALPEHQPLARLLDALDLDAARDEPVVPPADRAWLLDEAQRLRESYARAVTPLGAGLIHGDVQPDNLLRDEDGRWLLIDWDRAGYGPRELDLAFAMPDHFHDAEAERNQFSSAYGYDLTAWAGWTMIRDLTELHSLASYIRRAPGNPAARDELRRRVVSLVTGDREVVWRSVSE